MLPPQSKIFTVILTALVAFGPLSTDMYLPSLPSMSQEFSASVSQVQLTLSVYLIGFACSQLVYGPLSDCFGRRPILMGGLCVYMVASTACFMVNSIEALIVARFFQSFGACAGPVLARAMVRDIHGPDKAAQVLAYMGSAMALAPAVAPMFGGYLQLWFGWQSTFVFLSVLALVLLGIVTVWVSESNEHRTPDALKPARLLGNYVFILKNRQFQGYVLVNSMVFSGLFAFISGSSFVLVDVFGLTPNLYGICFGIVVCGYITGTLLVGRLSKTLGIRKLLGAGSCVALIGGIMLVAAAWLNWGGVAGVIGPMVVFLIGVGLVMPNSMAGAIGPFGQMAGAASALMGFIQMMFGASAGIAVGLLHNGTSLPMAVIIGGMGVMTFVFFMVLVRPQPA